MIGAFVGDINGSLYEYGNSLKTKDVELWQKNMYFTDDSVCTLAVMKTLINNFPIQYTEKNLLKISQDLINNFKYFNFFVDSFSYVFGINKIFNSFSISTTRFFDSANSSLASSRMSSSSSISRSSRLSSMFCFSCLYSVYFSTIGAKSFCSFINLSWW